MSATAIDRLRGMMAALRDPNSGCPWDLAQDFASIGPYTLEEAYEVVDVIEREAWDELPGELGDLLLQVVFHAQMASERGWFTFDDVAGSIADKLHRRHPHVFGDGDARTPNAVQQAWETIKAAERGADASALAGVARALPALTRAQKLGKRAARTGFDWPGPAGVIEKIHEELAEVAACAEDDAAGREEEIGDLLFCVVNYARHLGVDAERALRGANRKFERRFRAVEAATAAVDLDALPPEDRLAALEAAWAQAKRHERKN